MKKSIILAAILFSLSVKAQKQESSIKSTIGQNPVVTDTLVIKIDTATYKYVIQLIKENIDTRSATGQTIAGNILQPLSKWSFLQPADKPKEIKVKQ